jgi:hypothetical protein
MKRIVQALLTLLMALTLNASMVIASTTHAATHYTETTTAEPCDHHGHSLEMSGDANEPIGDDCPQQLCPSCTGLQLSVVAAQDHASHHLVAPFSVTHWSPSWHPPLFRPPIHI